MFGFKVCLNNTKCEDPSVFFETRTESEVKGKKLTQSDKWVFNNWKWDNIYLCNLNYFK